ncbi:hypothetical protein [Catenulispora subtropica]|uniref:DUF4253 domain-containing protein n=1 Tax=Catenulispora subtropica TaxID=450798 RepID=A0ABN2RNW3_9ACTN
MSKFRINVCLPASATADVEVALTTAMAPFDMNLSADYNPDGMWDWWRIDAGEDQRFVVKPEHDGDPRLIHSDPDAVGYQRQPLRCDGGPRGLLDFNASRREALAQALSQWEAEQQDFQRLVADHPPAHPLTEFLARHAADPDIYPREQAVADHHTQPLVQALNHGSAWDRYPNLGLWVLGPNSDPISSFTQDPQPGFAHAEAWAIMATALLTLNGEWIESDQLGSFTDVRTGEDKYDAYARQATDYLAALDDDCIIVRLLCHC